MSYREAAKKVHVSHTAVFNARRALMEAADRGVLDEYRRRINQGDKRSAIEADLMPDYLEHRRLKQRAAAFRSAVRKLIYEHGVEPELLIEVVQAIASERS